MLYCWGSSFLNRLGGSIMCIYKTRLVIFRTTEEKLEKKRKANLNTEATSSISFILMIYFYKENNYSDDQECI